MPSTAKPTLTLRVFVEGFTKHLATVRVLADVSLKRLRGLLLRIPFMPKHYRFLNSDQVGDRGRPRRLSMGAGAGPLRCVCGVKGWFWGGSKGRPLALACL